MFQGHLLETLGMTIGVIRYLLRLERTIARRRGTFSAYRPISLKAKHFGFWREEAQFSSCLEFLCSSRLIKGQWCFCPTSQLTGNYVFTIICNVIYKLYEILKNVGKCVLGDL